MSSDQLIAVQKGGGLGPGEKKTELQLAPRSETQGLKEMKAEVEAEEASLEAEKLQDWDKDSVLPEWRGGL